MAYNRGYSGNPDALPAHAEPEQAAAMLHGGRQSSGQRPPSTTHTSSPAPRPDDRYNRPSSTTYNSDSRYSNAPPPPGPNRASITSPPPPANYGSGPRPAPQPVSRPTIPQSQRPPTVAPPSRSQAERDALWPLFVSVDRDRTGQLSEESLRRALVNGDYTAFDQHTVKMMIRMFDTDRSGTVNFDEFCGLWGFLAAWRGLFDRFDTDRSGHISMGEFSDALVAFGYRLSPGFVGLLFGTFARNVGGRGDDGAREKGLSFDLFVQACISLKRMTDVFKKYDEDRDGYITLSFEEFLTGAQSLFLFNSISPQTDTGLY
ncbi:Programmed cell death protein 6 [Sphaceloma murrayae]|uniref:Programmed cell death protein 6 n=1 Tax=Sphaceloma murrayae TaxID=2082308 RepID=A0A2K1QYR2_9PEZI|nr:Programmed cell death protein 6 [Sphaceloma murrayae]